MITQHTGSTAALLTNLSHLWCVHSPQLRYTYVNTVILNNFRLLGKGRYSSHSLTRNAILEIPLKFGTPENVLRLYDLHDPLKTKLFQNKSYNCETVRRISIIWSRNLIIPVWFFMCLTKIQCKHWDSARNTYSSCEDIEYVQYVMKCPNQYHFFVTQERCRFQSRRGSRNFSKGGG